MNATRCHHGLIAAFCATCQAPAITDAKRSAQEARSATLCLRCVSRPQAGGKRRPTGPLAAFCDQCRSTARRRLNRAGWATWTEDQLLRELRRPGERGPAPGGGQ